MFRTCLHTTFHTPRSDGSLVIAVKLKAERIFSHGRHVVLYSTKIDTFIKETHFWNILSYIISGPYIKRCYTRYQLISSCIRHVVNTHWQKYPLFAPDMGAFHINVWINISSWNINEGTTQILQNYSKLIKVWSHIYIWLLIKIAEQLSRNNLSSYIFIKHYNHQHKHRSATQVWQLIHQRKCSWKSRSNDTRLNLIKTHGFSRNKSTSLSTKNRTEIRLHVNV